MEQMPKPSKSISQIMRSQMLVLCVVAFVISVFVTSIVQTYDAQVGSGVLLRLNVNDVRQEILDRSDQNLLDITRKIAVQYSDRETALNDNYIQTALKSFGYPLTEEGYLMYLKAVEDVDEINVVSPDGIITMSTNPDFFGFDMTSGAQSAEFLTLNNGENTEFVQAYQPISFDGSKSMKYAGVALDEGGFLQTGYGFDKFLEDIGGDVLGITDNRHIGETGNMVVIAEDGQILTRKSDKKEAGNIAEYGVSMERLEELTNGEVYRVTVNGEAQFLLGTKVEGYYILGYLSEAEVYASRNTSLALITSIEAVLFVAMYFLMYALVKKLVVSSIETMTEDLDRISEGNLEVTVDVSGNREFEKLSKDINDTVNVLKDHIEAEARRVDADLEFAKMVQQSALPMVFPPFPDRTDFEIYASMLPAKEVGGDFYDFGLIGDRYLGFCVADVSGKGIPAAMFMMRAKTLIKDYGQTGMAPSQVLTVVNDILCENNPAGMFITAWMGVLDLRTGRLTYSNAGHNPPLIYTPEKGYDYLRTEQPNLVLAGLEGTKYRPGVLNLNPGDQLFLYTDGVTEATNTELELYGEERLRKSLNSNSTESCQEQCTDAYLDLLHFTKNAQQFDDITMMCIRFLGEENTLTIDAEIENYDFMIQFISDRLQLFECPDNEADKILIAADEIIANVVYYAYGEADGRLTIRIQKLENPAGVKITFTDYGVPFNPLLKPDPDIQLSAEDRKIGGLGIYMVKKMMDKVEYLYLNSNNLSITKYF